MAIIPRHSRSHGYNNLFFDSFNGAASFLALEPIDEKPEQDPETQGALPSSTSSRQPWIATPEALDKLLASLCPDRDKAAQEYEKIRLKLLRFFEWRGCPVGDRLTDEAFDRVMRKLDEGQVISNVPAFLYSVAKYILMEWKKEENPATLKSETLLPAVDPAPLELDEEDPRIRCFDRCLAEVPKEDRETLLEYYTGEKREKIEGRTKLAQKLDISLNALRIRVHRIRKGLEKSVKKYLSEERE